ncbi:GMP synthase (glutamine-hydrolysing) [Solirubrobacter pauli]|uniref:GMP synthase (Glutamine-hydrolysing) n=1 Tax=Solirubrobacter pauli TaxID=166793 RepID=A0A660LEY1_9ACTN|nr:type 1 glutamine amidotransferase [Solirubrobacter pauli]RKQ93642.1 GMP synthase (glutamine-hydrolysing) [Solirubrobacter pauli]
MTDQYPRIAVIHHLQQPFLGNAAAPLGPVEEHFRGELPELEGLDAIVAFGGEQDAWDPALADEVALIAEAVERQIPFLGVCLGAQLLARATGGENLRLPKRFLSWEPLTVLDPTDPVLGAIPAGAHALHWNQDGFEPPAHAVEVYARPAGGRAEGFRVGPCAWGVQFHPEVDQAAVDGWYAGWPESAAAAGTTEEAARVADALHLPSQAALSQAIFGAFARVANQLAVSR